MTDNRQYRPFAITAHTPGHPRKLFTPLIVANLNAGGEIVATRVNAMWDTGAECCLMSRDLAVMLNVDFPCSLRAGGVTGDVDAPYGYAYVALLANGQLIDVETAIVDSTSPSGEYSFIIGLNFIRKGTLAITSTPLDTTLSFVIPSAEPIDFSRLTSGDKATLPLSSATESVRPHYGRDALALIIPKE